MSPEHAPDLSTFSESGLFSLYRAILSELKHRGVIRTGNAPIGDYAEYLVATAPRYVVESSAIYRQHVNGKVLFARPEIMGHPDASDLTVTLRAAQTGRETV